MFDLTQLSIVYYLINTWHSHISIWCGSIKQFIQFKWCILCHDMTENWLMFVSLFCAHSRRRSLYNFYFILTATFIAARQLHLNPSKWLALSWLFKPICWVLLSGNISWSDELTSRFIDSRFSTQKCSNIFIHKNPNRLIRNINLLHENIYILTHQRSKWMLRYLLALIHDMYTYILNVLYTVMGKKLAGKNRM